MTSFETITTIFTDKFPKNIKINLFFPHMHKVTFSA